MKTKRRDARIRYRMTAPSHQPENIASVWNQVAATYASIDPEAPDRIAYHNHLLQAIGDPKGLTICEVGCGSGTTSAFFASLGARITLVDLTAGALRFAHDHFHRLGLAADYAQMNGLRMGIRDGAFDVTWNGGVIEHFTDEGKIGLIREMYRVVKPGGLLLIIVPNAHDWPFRLGKWIAERRGKWIFGFEDDLSAGRFRRLAAGAGLTRVELSAFNPIVGWWFLPYGRKLMDLLRLNTPAWHRKRSRFGHALALVVRKP